MLTFFPKPRNILNPGTALSAHRSSREENGSLRAHLQRWSPVLYRV